MSGGWLEVVAALAAALAATFAGVAMVQNRLQNRRSATFEHLRLIDERLQPIWHADPEDLRAELVSFYRHERDELSASAVDYLALFNALDLLALARERRAVSRRIADEYLATLFRGKLITLDFIQELQEIAQDASVYEHLSRRVVEFRSGQRRTGSTRHSTRPPTSLPGG